MLRLVTDSPTPVNDALEAVVEGFAYRYENTFSTAAIRAVLLGALDDLRGSIHPDTLLDMAIRLASARLETLAQALVERQDVAELTAQGWGA